MNGLYIAFENPNIHSIWPESSVEADKKRVFGVPAGKGAFEYFFEPILPDLQPYYWLGQIFDSTPFIDLIYKPGGEKELGDYQIDIPEFENHSAIGMKCGILPKYVNMLRDDNMDLIGLTGPENTFKPVALELFGARDWTKHKLVRSIYYDLIEKYSEICFFCDDGRSWEIYSKLDGLLSLVSNRVKGMTAITLKNSVLHKRDKDLFNNWGKPG